MRSAVSLVPVQKRLSLMAAAILLAACASPPDKPAPVSTKARPEAALAPRANTAPAAPGFTVLAPLAGALSAFEKQGVRYYAVLQKATFTYEERDGTALLKLQELERVDGLALDKEAPAGTCQALGSPYNELTVDYPYAAVLTRGAATDSVTTAERKPIRLRAMADSDAPNRSVYKGPGRKPVEFDYDRCVGAHKADGPGHRTDTHLPADARITLRRAKGKGPLTIALDGRFSPFVMLHHAEKKVSVAPSRIVLVDIDAEARRLHIHYRSLFRGDTTVREVELRAVIPETLGGAASPGESPKDFRERSAAMLSWLARCEPRTGYSEPCAELTRVAPGANSR